MGRSTERRKRWLTLSPKAWKRRVRSGGRREEQTPHVVAPVALMAATSSSRGQIKRQLPPERRGRWASSARHCGNSLSAGGARKDSDDDDDKEADQGEEEALLLLCMMMTLGAAGRPALWR